MAHRRPAWRANDSRDATTAALTVGCFVAALVVLPTHAQDVTNAPELHVGDEWVFHQTGTANGDPVDLTWRRKLAESLPDGKFRIEPTTRGFDVVDASWNLRHPMRPDFWAIDFKFPFKVGDSWTFASPAGARDTEGKSYDLHGAHKVVALESITVPAGTFSCFKIVGESSFVTIQSVADAEHRRVESWKMTRWYCPTVRYVAKLRTERYSAGGKGNYYISDSELVSFSRSATP